MTKRSPNRQPTHPGELLREVVLPGLTLSKTEVAKRLGISRQNLYDLINCKISVVPEMAVRLGTFFGNSPEMWLRMQAAHDCWAIAQQSEIEAIKPVTDEERTAA